MSKKCLFDCKAQQKIKKLSKKYFFYCKAQQKNKQLSKKCIFDCKAQQKTKKCQKSVPGGVFYPVVFFNSVHPVVKNSLACKNVKGGNLSSGLAMRDNQHGSARKCTEAHGSDVVLLCARKRTEAKYGRSGLVYCRGPVWFILCYKPDRSQTVEPKC